MSGLSRVLSRVTPPGNAYGLYSRERSASDESADTSGRSASDENTSSTTTSSTTSSLLTSTSSSTTSSTSSTTTSSTISSLLTSTSSYLASTLATVSSVPAALIANTTGTVEASMMDSSDNESKAFPVYVAVGSSLLALGSILVYIALKRKYEQEDEENTYVCDETDVNDMGYAPQALYCEPTTSTIEMTYNEYEESVMPMSYDNVAEDGMQMYDFASEDSLYSDGGYMFSENAYDVAGGGSFYEEGCENSYELACSN